MGGGVRQLLVPSMSWLLSALRAVGPDLLVRHVLVGVDEDLLVAMLGDLLLLKVLKYLFRIVA